MPGLAAASSADEPKERPFRSDPGSNLQKLKMADVETTDEPTVGLSSTYLVGVITGAVVIVSLIFSRLFFSKPKLNLPPTPKGIPLFGTMLKTRGPKTHSILIEYIKELGPLYALKTGLKYFIVVTSPEIAWEALLKNAQVFSSRPKLLSRLNFTGWRSVNSALYGDYWRGIRKNLVTQVTSGSKVASFAPFREEELVTLMERIDREAKSNDNVITFLPHCRFTVFSILLHVCFSKRFNAEDIEELDAILKRLLIILAPQVIDFIPFLQRFSKKHKNECQLLLDRMRKMFTPLIDEHRVMRNNGAPELDYVDSLIVLQKEMNLKETDVLGLIGEVLTGGTDTTANTLEWTMANLVKHPEIQQRLYEEIQEVTGGHIVQEAQLVKLKYLQAVVKEGLRKHPPLPFGITHGVTQQTKFRGYDIPEDAMVLFHIQAMQNDPTIWKDPDVFNPERFLNNDPNYDMTGSHGPKSLEFIPFGAGRRICPGMNLGLTHAHLILARLIQRYEFTKVNPNEEIDFDDALRFAVVMVNPLKARIKLRSS
ncbi:hypothetical protein R1sor_024005 [Riccia sorocarpa]|uniref:Cytochrome P450 n=1 Tax=Riccia sorocarpa TaxID=122646 RepID=A0ABD3GV80_9MARC